MLPLTEDEPDDPVEPLAEELPVEPDRPLEEEPPPVEELEPALRERSSFLDSSSEDPKSELMNPPLDLSRL